MFSIMKPYGKWNILQACEFTGFLNHQLILSTVLTLFISGTFEAKSRLLKSLIWAEKSPDLEEQKQWYIYIFHDRASMWSDIF